MSYTPGVELGTVRTTAVTNSVGRLSPPTTTSAGFVEPKADAAGREEDEIAARTVASRDAAGGLPTDTPAPHAAGPGTPGPRTQPVPVVGADALPEGPEDAPGPGPSRTGIEELDALPWMPYTGPNPAVPITGPHPAVDEHARVDRPAAVPGAPAPLEVPLPDERPEAVSRRPRLYTLRRSTERLAEDEEAPEGRPGRVGRPRTKRTDPGRLAEPDDGEGVNRTLVIATAGLALLVVGLCALLAIGPSGEATGPGGARSGGRSGFWPELADSVIVSDPAAPGDDAAGTATTSSPAASAGVPKGPPTATAHGASRRAEGRRGEPAGAARDGDRGTTGTHSGGADDAGGAPPSAGPALTGPPSSPSTSTTASTAPPTTSPAPAPAPTAPSTTLAPTTTLAPAPPPAAAPAP